MNVYDFDETIYNGDSTKRFYFYCIKRHPSCICSIPKSILYFIFYKCKFCSKTKFKEEFYSFLSFIPNIDSFLENFWRKEISNFNEWYLKQQEKTDIIITASPEFLVKPACDIIGIKFLIGSRVNKFTGKTIGENCRGEEKVIRLNEQFPGCSVENFYSDSYSDTPLAKYAKESFMVKKSRITPWEFK